MKIAVPVNGPALTEGISGSFGRAPYFLIHDGERPDIFVENPAVESPDGAGVKAAQLLVEQGATVLLTPRLGGNAARVVKAAGIEVYKTGDESIAEGLEAYRQGKLARLDQISAGRHGYGKH